MSTRFTKTAFLFFAFCILSQAVSAQSGGLHLLSQNASLSSEQSLSQKEALVRRARLLQLTGDIEGSADSWMAVFSLENDNYAALLEAAFCFFAIGDFEKAEGNLSLVLNGTKNEGLLRRASYLNAKVEAFRLESLNSLIELSRNPSYELFRPAIYYTLWKLSEIENYKTQLLEEYPLSPEALIVNDDRPSISPIPSAMWILFPGRLNINFDSSPTEASGSL
jgi:hypothetical protein